MYFARDAAVVILNGVISTSLNFINQELPVTNAPRALASMIKKETGGGIDS